MSLRSDIEGWRDEARKEREAARNAGQWVVRDIRDGQAQMADRILALLDGVVEVETIAEACRQCERHHIKALVDMGGGREDKRIRILILQGESDG